MGTNLHRAIEAHDLETLARLLAAGDDPNALLPEWPGWSPLDAAINELEDGGDVEAVALLLRHGARCDLQHRDSTGTPLAMAIFCGHREAALMLLMASWIRFPATRVKAAVLAMRACPGNPSDRPAVRRS